MPAIIDTTVWIDFFRNRDTEQTDLLEVLIRRGDAALGDIILSDVLQGIDSDGEFRSVKRHFSDFPTYPMIGRRNAIQSAVNYRKLRAKGFTVRKIVDCWIATFCIEHGFPLSAVSIGVIFGKESIHQPVEQHKIIRLPQGYVLPSLTLPTTIESSSPRVVPR